MSALLFSNFRVTNMKLINEKNSLIIAVSKLHEQCHVILYLACFVVSALDFNGLCKFVNIFINKITEEIQ